MANLYKLLLSPSGRIGRRDYVIGIVAFFIITTVFNLALKTLGNSMLAFWLSIPFPFLVIHMTYSVYGKRLHDIGRSFWPVTGLIVALIAIAITVMMIFGGSEYFAGFGEYTRENPPSEALSAQLQDAYQAELAKGAGWLYGSMCGLIGAFTIWLAVAKSEVGTNSYGAPTTG